MGGGDGATPHPVPDVPPSIATLLRDLEERGVAALAGWLGCECGTIRRDAVMIVTHCERKPDGYCATGTCPGAAVHLLGDLTPETLRLLGDAVIEDYRRRHGRAVSVVIGTAVHRVMTAPSEIDERGRVLPLIPRSAPPAPASLLWPWWQRSSASHTRR